MIIHGFKVQEQFFKAFAHGKRLEILNLILNRELPVTEIYEMLDLPQPNISQHLMQLRRAKIVKTKRIGKTIYYSIADPKIIDAYRIFREYLIRTETNNKLRNELSKDPSIMLPLIHDPVCHMQVSRNTSEFQYSYGGKQYVFCASGCLKKFKHHPKKYI